MNQHELHKIAPTLLQLQRVESFQVPENYFDSVQDNLHELLLTEPKMPTFLIPENYFAEFENVVQSKILMERKFSFETPENYFEKLPHKVQQKIVVNSKQNISYQWKPALRFAFASVLFGLFLFGTYLLFENSYQRKSVSNLSKSKLIKGKENQVAVVSTKNGLRIIVSEQTQIEIHNHVTQHMIESIDESMIVEELAAENQNWKNENVEDIQNFLIENNVDEITLEESVN